MILNPFIYQSGGGGGISLSSIAVTTPPTKTAYTALETFDPTGMVVTATYSNGATRTVTGYSVSPQVLSYGTSSVTISFTEDGVTKTATQAVTVSKITPTITLSANTVTLDASHLTATVTVTTDSDGAISVSSSDTGVATASESGGTVTISSVNDTTGTATITVSTTETTNYAAGSAAVSVSAEFTPAIDTLENTSWADISAVSAAGQGANYWSVGDTKTIALSGTCGTLALNTTLYCYILGFNHNSSKEGNGIHFGTWKTAASNGVDVCLVDANYGSKKSDGTKTFNMNHWGTTSAPYNTNYGGWKGCDARYDILGSTKTAPSGYGARATTSRVGYDAPSDTATSPVSNTLMSCLPSALRSVMKPMTKYTNNVGNFNNTDAAISSSIDYLPLLAEFEVFGARTYANQYEKNYQTQYTYYSSGNSKVKYKHNAKTTTANWWERSPCWDAAGGSGFCTGGTNGAADYFSSWDPYGLAPIFKV